MVIKIRSVIPFSIFLGVVLIFGGCKKKNNDDPVPTADNMFFYTVSYRAVNNGDPNVDGISLDTYTWFPRQDKTCWFGHSFQEVTTNDTLTLSIDGPYSLKGYEGCTSEMTVSIFFKEPVYNSFVPPDENGKQLSYSKSYIIPQHIIQNRKEALITFVWPSDTLKYQEAH